MEEYPPKMASHRLPNQNCPQIGLFLTRQVDVPKWMSSEYLQRPTPRLLDPIMLVRLDKLKTMWTLVLIDRSMHRGILMERQNKGGQPVIPDCSRHLLPYPDHFNYGHTIQDDGGTDGSNAWETPILEQWFNRVLERQAISEQG